MKKKTKTNPRLAFGVDPRRCETYSLRQARYDAIAEDIDALAGQAARAGQRLAVGDIGCGEGTLYRHLERRPHCAAIDLTGIDYIEKNVYQKQAYKAVYLDDLMAGNPNTPSEVFDVVVCEQVLEHLPEIDRAIAALARITRKGGKIVIGAPVFIFPVAFVRAAFVKICLKINPNMHWSHIQTFSQASLMRAIRRNANAKLLSVRGFRIISGGVLRPLENYRWWWRFNRWLGRIMPWACIEIQAIFEKTEV